MELTEWTGIRKRFAQRAEEDCGGGRQDQMTKFSKLTKWKRGRF
jgi:hypothetical protein